MTLYRWSQTASSDATADPTINWAEGQAPSSINDSARAMMAATAKYRDDIAGAIVTTGTSIAYAISSYQVFDAAAHLGGQMIAFTPHTTNGAGPVTLNIDNLGAKPLRSAPNVELLAGTIIQGTPYVATYNNSDGATSRSAPASTIGPRAPRTAVSRSPMGRRFRVPLMQRSLRYSEPPTGAATGQRRSICRTNVGGSRFRLTVWEARRQAA